MRVFIINNYCLVQDKFTVAKVIKLAGEYLIPLYKGIATTTFCISPSSKMCSQITLLQPQKKNRNTTERTQQYCGLYI